MLHLLSASQITLAIHRRTTLAQYARMPLFTTRGFAHVSFIIITDHRQQSGVHDPFGLSGDYN